MTIVPAFVPRVRLSDRARDAIMVSAIFAGCTAFAFIVLAGFRAVGSL